MWKIKEIIKKNRIARTNNFLKKNHCKISKEIRNWEIFNVFYISCLCISSLWSLKYFRSATNNLDENNTCIRSICVCPVFENDLFFYLWNVMQAVFRERMQNSEFAIKPSPTKCYLYIIAVLIYTCTCIDTRARNWTKAWLGASRAVVHSEGSVFRDGYNELRV